VPLIDGDGDRDSYGKAIERIVKRAARSILARLASGGRRRSNLPVDLNSVRSIIVIRQHNQFGDVLCTVPLLRSVSEKFKLQELAVVVSPQNVDALAGCKYVTKLISYDKLAFYRRPLLFLNFIKELRKGYDILLVPSNVSLSLTNDVMAFFVKAKRKIGPASLESRSNRTGSVYDIAVDLKWGDKPLHQVYRNMKVAEPLGIGKESDTGLLEYKIDTRADDEARAFIARLAAGSGPKIAFHAGAGKVPNRWNVDSFAALSDLLRRELKTEIFLTEGPMDHDVVDELTRMIKVPFFRVRNKAVSFVAALLKQMDLVITNDTGIMHLSAAVGTPTLSLFGPTDPLQWAPLGGRNRFIVGKGGDINTIGVNKTFALAKKVLQIN
jgi:ADP-heptose:LPS heptosyltransferase